LIEDDEWGDGDIVEQNGVEDEEPLISMHTITGSPTQEQCERNAG
jgi:hypothetical protein